jgi:hypothetical protein
MVPPRAATLCGFTSASRKPPDGFLPSGVDMVKFHVDSDGALNGGGGSNGADIFGAIETPCASIGVCTRGHSGSPYRMHPLLARTV